MNTWFLFSITFFLMVVNNPLSAQDKNEFSIETDPATYLFKGYALHGRWSPAHTPHWRLGLGAYAMDFPKILVDLNPKNAGKDWDVRLLNGIGLFTEYFLKKDRQGWFGGIQTALQRYELKQPEKPGKARYDILLIMPYAGYRWFPGQSGLYITPWMGLGYARKISGTVHLAGKTFDVAPLVPFITVHIGYTF